MIIKKKLENINLIFPPVCGAEAQASHLAWQRSVSIAAVVSIKSSGVVVLSVPCSSPVSIAVNIVGFGVSVILVNRLGSLQRGHGFRGIRRFAAVSAISAGDGTEILKRKTNQKLRHI